MADSEQGQGAEAGQGPAAGSNVPPPASLAAHSTASTPAISPPPSQLLPFATPLDPTHLGLVVGVTLALSVVGGVHVGGARLKLGRACVHALHAHLHAQLLARLAHCRRVRVWERGGGSGLKLWVAWPCTAARWRAVLSDQASSPDIIRSHQPSSLGPSTHNATHLSSCRSPRRARSGSRRSRAA